MQCAPILVLIFNRPEYTKRMFARLREIQPPVLYIAADGPRKGNAKDDEMCAKARFEASQVDWPCAVQRLYREQNLGCRNGVRSAIDWFFENEESGIILEDDCLPQISFPGFCSELLERYKDREDVMHISGTNYQFGEQRGDGDYYFSRYSHIWGWATWRRCWRLYDKDMRYYDEMKNEPIVDKMGIRKMVAPVYEENIDTWDAQWLMTVVKYGGKTATPQTNLVRNIGFDRKNATHTFSIPLWMYKLTFGDVKLPLKHPSTEEINEEADAFARDNVINEPKQSFIKRWMFRARYASIFNTKP
jgi:hypothetical protein